LDVIKKVINFAVCLLISNDMPKQKTHSGASKRFAVTGSGKIKRKHAFKRHNLRKRTTKAKMALTHTAMVHPSDAGRIHLLVG